MKTLTAREFREQWTDLTGEVVLVTSRGRKLGHWVPGDNPLRWEDNMDDTVKKAIEPERVKQTPAGPTKGLGDVPGLTGPVTDAENLARYGFRPVPKPGKKK